MTTPALIVGLAWYRAEEYSAIRRIMADGHKFAGTFNEWRRIAEGIEQNLRRDGQTVVRAIIDPKTFPEWCRARGLNVDAQARMDFANAIAYEHTRSLH